MNESTNTRILSIVPYRILPARLGGEKGIAIFNEYIARELTLVAAGVEANSVAYAKGYTFLKILSNSRLRYANPVLYFRVRKLLKQYHSTHLLIEHPYYAWLAWLLKATTPVTWVIHSHNLEFERSRSIGRWWWKALKWYEQWAYHSCDKIFFISEEDRQKAIRVLHVEPSKSIAITYGVEVAQLPEDRSFCREVIGKRHGIPAHHKVLLFNGALYHHSNYDALQAILDHINPYLLQCGIPYTIVVCGKGLPDFFNELKEYRHLNIVYAGFVDDIFEYFKASDIFLNPILSGGGVKTKAIEAVAYGSTVVSTEFGAMGLDRAACGDKLKVLPDQDWNAFNEEVKNCLQSTIQTPAAFYEFYYWGNLAKKAAQFLSQ